MIETIIGLGIALAGVIAGYLIREGIHRREHMVIKDTLGTHTVLLDKHDTRLDEHDVVNATILTSLSYIQAGIDEIKKEVKK